MTVLTDELTVPTVPCRVLSVLASVLETGAVMELAAGSVTPDVEAAGVHDGRLGPRERRALEVLRERFPNQTVTAGQWRAAAQMPETTFLRARRLLVERGLVSYSGAGRAGRYGLTEMGQDAELPV